MQRLEVSGAVRPLHESLGIKGLIEQVKGKAIPLQVWKGPEGFRRLRLPDFQDNRHVKVVRLSALRTGLVCPTGHIPGTHLC